MPHFPRLGPPRRRTSQWREHFHRPPQVGLIRLDREKLSITGTDGAMLGIYQSEPGTDRAEEFALLGVATAVRTPRKDMTKVRTQSTVDRSCFTTRFRIEYGASRHGTRLRARPLARFRASAIRL